MPDVSRRALIKVTAIGAAMLPAGLAMDPASAEEHSAQEHAQAPPRRARPKPVPPLRRTPPLQPNPPSISS
jgi:hypothetical protein